MRLLSKSGAIAATAVMIAVVFSLPVSAGEKEWTVLVYLDGDNNLEVYGDMNIEWLMTAGSTDYVNYVVLYDKLSGPADLLYIEYGEVVSVGSAYGYPKEVNMADPAVLQEFIEIGVRDFPAQRYMVDLWDHGGGWRGICWDDTTLEETGISDCITMVDLREAFEGAYATTERVIDIVAFDACLMAMPEVSYQVRDYASYVVFSEETVPGYGFPYDLFSAALNAEPTMDGREFSTCLVEKYAEFYSSISGYIDWTMSAFDMAYMDEVTAAVDYLGTELLDGILDYMQAYQRDYIMSDRYYYPYNTDLIGFAQNLIADPVIEDEGIKDAARQVVAAVTPAIVAVANGIHNVDSTGMAIYLPSTNDGMKSIKESYVDIPFALDTSWYSFCDAFSNWYGRTWGSTPLRA